MFWCWIYTELADLSTAHSRRIAIGIEVWDEELASLYSNCRTAWTAKGESDGVWCCRLVAENQGESEVGQIGGTRVIEDLLDCCRRKVL